MDDNKENKYFDGFSTLWTNWVGHGRDEIVDAMARQSKKLSFMHLFGGSQHDSAIELAEKLLEISPVGQRHRYFGLSGSDATETSIKLARNFWFKRENSEKK